MAKSIITVGLEIPGVKTKYASLNSKLSLLDFDISVFNPSIYSYYGYEKEYMGKPALNDSESFKLKEDLKHWRREILEAVKAGKTVFLLLNDLEEVFVATGKVSYTGTGRNRRGTRHVDLHSNYSIIPGGIDVVASKGKSMKLHGSNNILSTYWSELSELSEYRVLISGDGVKPLIITRTGEKIVGSRLMYENAPGSLFLLPYINFERDKFAEFDKEKEKDYWTKEAVQFGNRLLSAIVGVDKAAREDSQISVAPDWVDSELYMLPAEKQIQSELLLIETKLEAIQKEKEIKQQLLLEETVLKRLLYEKGKPLENAVRIALTLMGFKVSPFENSESEFDVVFECEDGRLIGEVEGRDSKSINIKKLRQLDMNINEDFDREHVTEMAKGALIGNAFRFSNPEARKEFFTEKCLTAANRSQIALIRSIDLFSVANFLSRKKSKVFSKNCRLEILNTTGVVVFPPFPRESKKKKDKLKVYDES